jgi:hypothetical protein
MNNIIKRYFEIKARDDNRPFVRLLSIAYQNDKITDDEALLFCSNNWKKMHGFKLEKYGKMDYRNKGFLWNDKVSLVINEKIMRVMKDYVANKRNGIGLSEKDVGSKKWESAFWNDLLGVISDGHV